jgi:acetoin utilization protein AcuB
MNADKLMRVEVTTVPPDLSLKAAHALMVRLSVRHLPVVSGQRLAGIVSDRDVLLAAGRGKDGAFTYPDISVGEVMSLSPISAGPESSVQDLAKTMVEAKIDALPIVSPQNELMGLVTSTDLILLLTRLPSDKQPQLSFSIRRASDLQARA